MMTDGENALRCAKNIQRPETERIRSQLIGPVVNIEIATIIDVSGIEVQVPSLSSPGYSVWILISRGHERFVNEIHRHNSDIVNYSSSSDIVNYSSSLRAKEDNLNDVSRIFTTCRGKARARLTGFEQCQNEG